MDGNLSTGSADQLDPIVQEWLNAFGNRNFSALDLRKFWSGHVPGLFKIPMGKDSLLHKFDQAQIDQVLFRPLEQFITASPNPTDMLNSLKNNEDLHKPVSVLVTFVAFATRGALLEPNSH